jgi:hypothetical protein
MRLVVPLCRHCRIKHKECNHYALVRNSIQKCELKGTLSYRCTEYFNSIPIGTRVKIKLHEIEIKHIYCSSSGDDYEPPRDDAKWIEAGESIGTVVEYKQNKDGFFLIELDNVVTLCLPQVNGDWLSAIEKEVKFTKRKNNKIEIITVETKL